MSGRLTLCGEGGEDRLAICRCRSVRVGGGGGWVGDVVLGVVAWGGGGGGGRIWCVCVCVCVRMCACVRECVYAAGVGSTECLRARRIRDM